MAPLRTVANADLREGNSINGGFLVRWWELELDCGHVVDRPVRFPKQTGIQRRGYAAMHHTRPRSERLPPPKRCRCRQCGQE